MSFASPLQDAFRVLDFWFNHAGSENWFAKDDAFDAAIAEHFSEIHAQAARGELDHWAETSSGGLALVIVLDQFSRNLYRDKADAFAQDAKARAIARQLIETGIHYSLGDQERVFLFLPFEHSEDPRDQAYSVDLFGRLEDQSYLEWAIKHKDIIDRFGRFPHRNAALGRDSTPEEEAFLKEPGSSF